MYPKPFGSFCRGCPPNTVPSAAALLPGRVPPDIARPRSREVRRAAIDSGTGEAGGEAAGGGGGGGGGAGGGQRRQRGRTRGRPPRAADDTKMPSASFSSSRSYVRRSRRKNGNRIPLPSRTSGKRASERTQRRKSERTSVRVSEEGRTEGASESEKTGRRQRRRLSVSGLRRGSRRPRRPRRFVRRTPSLRPVDASRRRVEFRGGRRRRSSGAVPAVSVVPLFPGLCTHAFARHAPRFLLALAPLYQSIPPRTHFCRFASVHSPTTSCPPVLPFRPPEILLSLGMAEFGKVLKEVTLNCLCSVKRRGKV